MARKLSLLFAVIFSCGTLSVLRGEDAVSRLPLTVAVIDDTLHTDWYGVYLANQKIGYARMERARLGLGEQAAIREALDMTMKVVASGLKAEMIMKQVMEFDARAPYRLRSAELREAGGDAVQKIKVARTPKGYSATITSGKEERVQPLGELDFTLADVMTPELWLRQGAKTGNKITFRDFDLHRLQPDITDCQILSAKTSLAGGVQVKYFEMESRSRLDDLNIRSRHDSSGRILSGVIGVVELRLEPEDQAKNFDYSQDLFLMGLAKVDRPIGNPTEITELILEAGGKEGALLSAGPRQAVSAKDTSYTLKLGKKHGQPVKATAKEIEECLADSATYPIQNAKIKALAQEAIGTAMTPEAKVKRLVEFVHDYIQPTPNVTQPNIHDLLDKKKGDCKSYSLLLTTLARAAGIPSRQVSGLMYTGDDQKAFAGHAWNEVVLDGFWVPVDASLAETEINATHICFGTDTRATNAMLHTLGKLSFRVLEVQKD